MNMNYIVLTEVILPIRWSSMYIHFSLAHGNNHCHRHAEIFFDDSQVASSLQAAKQHSRPFCRLANKATIHRPCSYGFETVIVLSGDFHPRPSRKQCHCTHPECLFAWLAATPASHVATWMSLPLPENTGVFSCRPIEKLPNHEVNMYWSRWHAHMHTHSSFGVKHMETTRQSC